MTEKPQQSMLVGAGKFVGGKLLTAVLIVAVALIGYWFYQNPEDIKTLWHIIQNALVWLALVAVLPWATFFMVPWVLSAESNGLAAALILGYWVVDIVAALWLAGWDVDGTLVWGLLLAGFLIAGIYNLLVCDYIAQRIEDRM